jgi:hypothetical protein
MAGGLRARSGADAALARGWLGQSERSTFEPAPRAKTAKVGSKQNQARQKLSSDAARCTLKFHPMLYLHNIKALWNAGRSYVPRNVVRLRKLGNAGLSALWATSFSVHWSRMIHRICAANRAFSSSERRHNQTDLPTALDAVQDSRPAELG